MIVAINKPKGPTSHDIIYKLRKITGIKKIGHAGTLDPLASGVLVVAITRESTKKISEIVKKEKEYIATIKLGQTSTTDDEEGEKSNTNINKEPNLDDVQSVLPKFIGEIEQIPPIYSAIKMKGVPAYKLARGGKNPEMKERKVNIKSIEVLDFSWPILKIKVVCGPGVYIRSLARDIGKVLGVGGYLSDLIRTRVGEYKIEDSFDINSFGDHWQNMS